MMPNFFVNKYNIKFGIYKGAISEDPTIYSDICVCSQCLNYYIDKKTALSHNCIKNKNKSKKSAKNKLENNKAMKYLVIWIAKKNISFRAITDPDFKGFIETLGDFKVPSETTIREFIKNFAKYITHKIYLTINNQNVSILIDEVTRNGAKYLGVVFFLPQKLFFLGLEPCQSATSFNISTIVTKYAQYIDHNHSHLVSVCSDNARNNVSALDGEAQKMADENFIRMPCTCHTANLALKDVLKQKHQEILNTVIFLISIFKEKSEIIPHIGKIPHFSEVRWFSIVDCVNFIIQNSIYFEEVKQIEYIEIQRKYGWNYVFSVLNTIKVLIEILERDKSSAADVFDNFYKTTYELTQIAQSNPHIAQFNLSIDVRDSLWSRFHSTVSLKIPCIAFFLTGPGLQLYENYINNINALNVENYLREYLSTREDCYKLCRFFRFYLNFRNNTLLKECPTTVDSFQFWSEVSQNGQFWKDEPQFSEDDHDLFGVETEFAAIAMEILTIPCSESPCERVFSHLSDLLQNNKRNLSFDMLNALMIIRINSIFMKQESDDLNEFIYGELGNLAQINYDEIDPSFEYDPLVNF